MSAVRGTSWSARPYFAFVGVVSDSWHASLSASFYRDVLVGIVGNLSAEKAQSAVSIVSRIGAGFQAKSLGCRAEKRGKLPFATSRSVRCCLCWAVDRRLSRWWSQHHLQCALFSRRSACNRSLLALLLLLISVDRAVCLSHAAVLARLHGWSQNLVLQAIDRQLVIAFDNRDSTGFRFRHCASSSSSPLSPDWSGGLPGNAQVTSITGNDLQPASDCCGRRLPVWLVADSAATLPSVTVSSANGVALSRGAGPARTVTSNAVHFPHPVRATPVMKPAKRGPSSGLTTCPSLMAAVVNCLCAHMPELMDERLKPVLH